jgi:hypothetical protein
LTFTAEYSLWFVLLCTLLAAAGSWFLYRHNPLSLTGKQGTIARWALMSLRFLTLFTISFLLLGPLMKLVTNRTEKPIVVLAIDGSQSIITNKDSSFYRNEFVAGITKLQQDLSDNFDVKTYTIGKNSTENFNGTFSEKQTNISQLFDAVKNNYSNQNLGAVVLATDGLYNDGNNPAYTARELRTPVYTVALGDTVQQKDLLIKQVSYNQLVYSGNEFPLHVDISAFGYSNKQTTLTVTNSGQTLFSTIVPINNLSFFTTIPISLEATKPGTQHYIVSVSSLSGEVSLVNNRFDVFINVIDGKQKIAVVYLAPHPDIAAYKNSIEQNENYSIKTFAYDKIPAAELKDYSLVLFHQLPGSRGEGINLVKTATDQHVPALFVLGAQTGLPYLNTTVPVINISANRSAVNEVTPGFSPGFASFTLSNEELERIKKFPPLYAPYGNYAMLTEHDILFTQQVGYVKTTAPLIAFAKSGGSKTGFICGEGFWKWQLYDLSSGNQKVAGSLMGKIVQYLAAKDDRSRFRITGKKRFDENEPVKFEAEVYNESYELINTGEITLTIKNTSGKKFPYAFGKNNLSYTLDIGLMPVGNYTYEASTVTGNKTQLLKGTFAVVPLQVEFLQTTANHQLLYELANETGGKLFSPHKLDELAQALKTNAVIKPIIYKQEHVKSWINLKWIFFTVLVFLSIEWFIRKWNGSI